MAFTKENIPSTAAEAFTRLAKVKMEPFTRSDWQSWCGCESNEPFIGYEGDPESEEVSDMITIIIDGDLLSFNLMFSDLTVEFAHFRLSADCYF